MSVFRQQAWRFFLDNRIFTADKDPGNDRLSETRDGCHCDHRLHIQYGTNLCEGEQQLLSQLQLSRLVCMRLLQLLSGLPCTCFVLFVWLCDLLIRALDPVFSNRFPVLTVCSVIVFFVGGDHHDLTALAGVFQPRKSLSVTTSCSVLDAPVERDTWMDPEQRTEKLWRSKLIVLELCKISTTMPPVTNSRQFALGFSF